MKLEDMSLHDLWDLFPIFLVPHQAVWKTWAEEEITTLYTLLYKFNPVITHIGSTAIPGIQAKPIIDIIVEVSPLIDLKEIKDTLQRDGYLCMSETEKRISFNKGYNPDGYAEKVYHIHLRRAGDNAEIQFRDYLISNPEKAHEYEILKQCLIKRYGKDRDAYTEAKSDFVRSVLSFG